MVSDLLSLRHVLWTQGLNPMNEDCHPLWFTYLDTLAPIFRDLYLAQWHRGQISVICIVMTDFAWSQET